MTHTTHRSVWSTTSFGGAADTSPMEIDALSEHLSTCCRQQGFLFGLRCAAEQVHRYLAGRFFTSLVVSVTLLVGTAVWVTRGGVI